MGGFYCSEWPPCTPFLNPSFAWFCYAYLGALRWEELLGQSTSPLAVVTFAIPPLQNLANDRMRECDGVVPTSMSHLCKAAMLANVSESRGIGHCASTACTTRRI